MSESIKLGNCVRARLEDDGAVTVYGNGRDRLEFSSVEELREFNDKVRCYADADGDMIASVTVLGQELSRLSVSEFKDWSGPKFNVDGMFTIYVEQLEEAADELEEIAARVEEEVYLKFASDAGSFGCVIPHDADFKLDPDAGGEGSMAVYWHADDDVGGLSYWTAPSPYDHGAYVNVEAEVVVR